MILLKRMVESFPIAIGIKVETKEGEGSEFIIQLPVV
jgi:hypothetical protein